QHVFSGFNVSVFAYGQTGSGKSFTMYGAGQLATMAGGLASPGGGVDTSGAGLIPRFCRDLFKRLKAEADANPTSVHTVEASYFQIYNERVFDLLPVGLLLAADASGGGGGGSGGGGGKAMAELDVLSIAAASQAKLRVREDPA